MCLTYRNVANSNLCQEQCSGDAVCAVCNMPAPPNAYASARGCAREGRCMITYRRGLRRCSFNRDGQCDSLYVWDGQRDSHAFCFVCPKENAPHSSPHCRWEQGRVQTEDGLTKYGTCWRSHQKRAGEAALVVHMACQCHLLHTPQYLQDCVKAAYRHGIAHADKPCATAQLLRRLGAGLRPRGGSRGMSVVCCKRRGREQMMQGNANGQALGASRCLNKT